MFPNTTLQKCVKLEKKYIFNMKSLYESLLDDEDVLVDKVDVKSLIEEWLKENDIKNYKINKDNTINVNGSVYLKRYPESELPSYIQFRNIKGSFSIYSNKLNTLKGCPEKVGISFDCAGCDSLQTLEGAPKIVGGHFHCSYCKSLKTLEGAPEKVGGLFECNSCPSLKSLEGAPKEVGWYFNCRNCGKEFTKEEVLSLCNCKGEIKL